MDEPYTAGNRAIKSIPKSEQRAIQDAIAEMRQLDIDARKPGFSKEKAAKRKAEIKRYLRSQGVSI